MYCDMLVYLFFCPSVCPSIHISPTTLHGRTSPDLYGCWLLQWLGGHFIMAMCGTLC